MPISGPCGGNGTCGKCRVIVSTKIKNEITDSEKKHLTEDEISNGMRLSCDVDVTEDMEIIVPNDGQSEIMTSGRNITSKLMPYIKKKHVKLDTPSLENQDSDCERLEKAVNAKIDYDCMDKIPDMLRENDFDVTAITVDNRIIAVEPKDTESKNYGIALDIGTTTMAGFLYDLTTGKQIGVYSAMNPQRPFGADVISRTDYTMENENGVKTLSDLVVNEINKMIQYFGEKHNVSSTDIYHMTLVGNTIMMHIFARLPVKNIAVSPFIPTISRSFDINPSKFGIKINNKGIITILPMVAGYVGADTVGAIMACDMLSSEKPSLMIDIGTNGEIALGNKDGIHACSTAAGPAFEGAQIRHGMGGVSGAIDSVIITGDVVKYTTIGDAPAKGICGSGIVDVAAQFKKAGIMDMMGRMLTVANAADNLPKKLAERVREVEGKAAFLIASKEEGAEIDVYIIQKDMREVQLAKAAIAAGIEILVKDAGIKMEEVEYLYLAGGFGNYIDKNHACDIKLLPEVLRDKIVPVGNAAGDGAKLALCSTDNLKLATKIKEMTKYIELSMRLDFQTVYVDFMMFD